MKFQYFYIFILCILVILNCKSVSAQRVLFKNDLSITLCIDYENRKFEIYDEDLKNANNRSDTISVDMEQDTTVIFNDFSETIPYPAEIREYSNGKINLQGKTITCYDKNLNRISKFLIIDEYTLKSIKSTAIFFYGEILKASFINDKQGNTYSLKWKNNKKDGQWIYNLKNGCKKVNGYRNGNLIYSKIICYRNKFRQD